LSRTASEQGEHFEGLRRELDHYAPLLQQLVSGIELERGEAQALDVFVPHRTVSA
jgi:hypothetical protein